MDGPDLDALKRMLSQYGARSLLEAVSQVVGESLRREVLSPTKEEPRCSFCKARQSEVEDRMVAGPGVLICIRCIDLCHRVRMEKWPEK